MQKAVVNESFSPPTSRVISNAEIAQKLASLAQLLATQGENPFKVKAYRRAAEVIKTLSESLYDQVLQSRDITVHDGIGKGIAQAIQEIVEKGSLARLDKLRSEVDPETAALSEFPRLDPKRVRRIYKALKISTVRQLQEELANGKLQLALGEEMAQHVRQAFSPNREMLLYEAEEFAGVFRQFLLEKCGVDRADIVGACRRRVEVVSEISFLIEADDFVSVMSNIGAYGGRAEIVSQEKDRATLRLSSGQPVSLTVSSPQKWGLGLVKSTGSDAHVAALEKVKPGLVSLEKSKAPLRNEASVYRALGLQNIPPELREGSDEIARAAKRGLPRLVEKGDIRGDLHAHSTSSDGAHSIEEMAEAALQRGYEYIGISDHSQSLKIAGGVSEENLWKQIRAIDRLNSKRKEIRILKSAEVDILTDGTLDYPDDLLKELDYTVCSIHSRFRLGKREQTERILRAMDNPFFTILGHATGRKLLKRAGYEIDLDRIIEHACERGCFFEINASPDRLDLSANNARRVHEAGIPIAVCTDAHAVDELDFLQWGIDQARRAGLDKGAVLNCLSLPQLAERLGFKLR